MITARQTVLPPISDPGVLDQIDRLARRYVAAGGLGMEIMSLTGSGAEGLIKRLPDILGQRLDRLTRIALMRAFSVAGGSRRVLRDRGDWFNRMASVLSGAIGGAGGIAGAAVELPVTVTLLLRAILDIAAEHGLDPDSDDVRKECLRIFADAGPMAEDDDVDLGLLAARLSVTGQTVQGLIGKVAPRLSAALGQKLAAQAAPVLGAVAGASINYTFTRYYQEIARVHFGIMRLSREADIPRDALIEALQIAIAKAGGRG